jgi:hypothetical protein
MGKGRNKKATAPKVDKAELQRKLITQQLEKIVSTAVKEEDSTLTKRKCRQVLAAIFGEARMEEFKSHLSAEVVRLVSECQNMSRDALEEFAEGCRAVTEEEIKAIDEPEPGSESSEEEPPVKPAKPKSRPNPRTPTPTAKKPSTKKPKAPTVDVSELARKLMTQHLQMLVSIAVRDKDSSLTKKKCREMLAPIFGEARVEEHKEHINVEVLRLVGEYRVLEEEALAEVVAGCRAVTEEEVKAMDAPPAAGEPEDESDTQSDEGDSSDRCALPHLLRSLVECFLLLGPSLTSTISADAHPQIHTNMLYLSTMPTCSRPDWAHLSKEGNKHALSLCLHSVRTRIRASTPGRKGPPRDRAKGCLVGW